MPGKYYLKHTINHSIDNKNRINNLNNNYKNVIKQNAIDYLKNTNENAYKKANYLKNLTHDVYRYGRKYRYECNLSNSDIDTIIRIVNDNELHKVYFNNTIEEADILNRKILFIVLAVLAFIVLLILL